MAFKPFTVDESITRIGGGGATRVAEGDYLLEVSGISPSPDTHTGEAYWRWETRIAQGPESVGRAFNEIGTWKADAQWGNGRILAAVGAAKLFDQLKGQTFGSYAQFTAITAQVAQLLKGKRFGVYIADGKPRDGKIYSEITEVYPEAEYEMRMKLRQAAPVQAPVANGAQPTGEIDLASAVGDLFPAGATSTGSLQL